jgi:hypothetical protein
VIYGHEKETDSARVPSAMHASAARRVPTRGEARKSPARDVGTHGLARHHRRARSSRGDAMKSEKEIRAEIRRAQESGAKPGNCEEVKNYFAGMAAALSWVLHESDEPGAPEDCAECRR